MSDEIDQIIDEFGEVRRLGSLCPPAGFVSSFNTFEDEKPVWDDADIRKVLQQGLPTCRDIFGPEWVHDQKSHGCHDGATEVLTESGWKRWDEYNGADALATMGPSTGLMEYQFPTHFHQYEYNGEVYKIDHASLNFTLTPNHRMFVRKWNERVRTLRDDYQFVEMKDIGWYCGLPASTSGSVGTDIKAVSFPGSTLQLSGDDFVALVSIIVSDGYAGGDETDGHNKVSFCCFHEGRRPMVEALAARCGFTEIPGRRGVWWRSDGAFAQWVRHHCYTSDMLGASNKRVPPIIKSMSMRQVNLFLDSFGDKTHSPEAINRVFYSSSKTLIDDIQELLLMIGKRSRVGCRPPRTATMSDGRQVVGRHNAWECVEWASDNLSITRKKQLHREHFNGNVFCATVPNRTLITRNNGQVLISGNSCNGYAGAGGLQAARWIRGIRDGLKLSGAHLYSKINGGRDMGSALEDGLKAIKKWGIAPADLVPWDQIYPQEQPRNADAEATKHKGLTCYAVQTRQGFRTAVAAGFPVIVAVHAGRNFQRLNAQGIAGVDSGRGNHATFVLGAKLIGGTECYDMQNSWNTRYGTGGRCFLTWDSFAQTFGTHTFYAIASTDDAGVDR